MIAETSSPASATVAGPLMTYADLRKRWRAEGRTEADRHRWTVRHCKLWGLRPLKGGRGDNARFRPADVLAAEARAAGERRPR